MRTQQLNMKRRISILWAFGLPAAISGLLLTAAACDKEIGDSCKQNVDCANDGSRICDSSSPGGYCTIEGCNGGGCPKEAVCIAFFPTSFLTTPCAPNTEDIHCAPCNPDDGDEGCNAYCDPETIYADCESCDPQGSDPPCNAQCDLGLPTDDCLPEEICLGNGMCARRDTERRYCMRKCSNNGDCRAKYICRMTGTYGAELAPALGQPYPHTERGFCAPREE
jgi:hypothetical protein